MNKHFKTAELDQMTVCERLRLMENLWESLHGAPQTITMPDWHREELDRRLAGSSRDAVKTRSWDDAKADLVQNFRK